MRQRALIIAGVLAVTAASIVPAQAGNDTIDRYHRLQASGIMKLTPDGRTIAGDIVGHEVVVDDAGEVLEKLPFKAKAEDRPFAGGSRTPCVEDSARDGFTAYLPPVSYPVDKKNEKGVFKFHFYSQDSARRNAYGDPTVQFIGCAAGGVDAQNGSRITISGPGMAFNDPHDSYVLGTNWKEGKTPEDYSITLGFEVPVRAVKVKGSITQNPSNSLKGSVVPPYGYGDMESFHENAANAWWEDGCRPRCSRFGGSNAYQGSVAEALWEFPQAAKYGVLERGFKYAGYVEHFCSNPFGC